MPIDITPFWGCNAALYPHSHCELTSLYNNIEAVRFFLEFFARSKRKSII